jgi:hypothetical protein
MIVVQDCYLFILSHRGIFNVMNPTARTPKMAGNPLKLWRFVFANRQSINFSSVAQILTLCPTCVALILIGQRCAELVWNFRSVYFEV